MPTTSPPVLTTPVSVSVHRAGDNPLFGETATLISVDDEAGGPFVVIEQNGEKIRLDAEELGPVFAAAQSLLAAHEALQQAEGR